MRNWVPIVSFGFKSERDGNGNFVPTFRIVGWKRRSDFAVTLGEAPATARPAGFDPSPM